MATRLPGALLRPTGLCKWHRSIRKMSSSKIHVCVVGSGVAGYYTAENLTKRNKSMVVDVYEKLPVPFGLVRYGVAPDNADIKKILKSLYRNMSRPEHNFYGNVEVGKDISIQDLQDAYHVIILSYGSSEERVLNIPGENLKNVIPAKDFVGWYNGYPDYAQLRPNLDAEEVAVIGHGNVSLDLARILLKPVDLLRKTDIAQHALEELSRSRVKKVRLIGRRGFIQVSFKPREMGELLEVPHLNLIVHPEDVIGYEEVMKAVERSQKKIVQVIYDTALRRKAPATVNENWRFTECELMFLRSPLEFTGTEDGVRTVRLGINRLDENDKAIATGETEEINSGLVIRSIGYKGRNIDGLVPFDPKSGTIKNQEGRVQNMPGVYCVGWIQTGPSRNISRTYNDGGALALEILSDIKTEAINTVSSKPGSEHILRLLEKKGVRPVTMEEWLKIDKVEKERGEALGKVREKILDFKEILNIAHGK